MAGNYPNSQCDFVDNSFTTVIWDRVCWTKPCVRLLQDSLEHYTEHWRLWILVPDTWCATNLAEQSTVSQKQCQMLVVLW